MNPQLWIETNFENVKTLDHDWTMERYDFPQNVRRWVEENWIKVSDVNGGTYNKPSNIPVKEAEEANKANEANEANEANKANEANQAAKSIAQMYQKTIYPVMDDLNKKAMDVMATQGMDAAVKHMFTDQGTGRQLSYGEMRMSYG